MLIRTAHDRLDRLPMARALEACTISPSNVAEKHNRVGSPVPFLSATESGAATPAALDTLGGKIIDCVGGPT